MIQDPASIRKRVPFPGHISMEINDRGIITIEGVKIDVWAIHDVLHNPVTDRLFSVRRDDDQLVFTTYENAEAAAKFFSA
jgi:hypothetical protein